jgi:hypothetical protein
MFAPEAALNEEHRRSRSARLGLGAVAFLVVAVSGWALVYGTGVFPWLGYAWLNEKSMGVGPITVIGRSSYGTSFGIDEFLFFKGQEIVIDYEADIRAGRLYFYVFRPFDGTLGDGVSHYVSRSGAGTWTTRIPATAIYTIVIDPTVVSGNGRGWDMSYSVAWGARLAR